MGDYREQQTHDMSSVSGISNVSVTDGGEGQACFMCLFSKMRPRAERDALCAVRRLNGRLVWAREREVNGTRIPSLMLDLGLSYALISLDPDYYRDIVRDMYARGDAIKGMSVVIYHLPTPVSTTTYKDRPLSHYVATSHTLVVLEPDILLNITDLSQADYCTRKYLLNRLVGSPSSAASVRGNIVHYSFTSLLKGDDQQRTTAQEQRQQPTLDVLRKYAEQALDVNAVEMAFASVPTDDMRLDVIPHLESLATWYEQNRNTLWGSMSAVRAETLLLVPEIGLRGRLDLFWEQLGSSVDGQGSQSLLELKTGGASGSLPKGDHRRQVHGYQALLAVRQNSKMKKAAAKLLYSGTPGQASDFALRLELTQLQRINALRNALVLNHITGTPSAPPPPSRCSKCSMLASCARISSLLNWQPPKTEENKVQNGVHSGMKQPTDFDEASADVEDNAVPPVPLFVPDSEADRAFFQRYYHLLQLEGIAEQQELATLWKLSVEERVANGKAIRDVVAQSEPVQQNDGWVQVFDCDNQSELREGDEVLVSDGDPITGEVVTGTLLNVVTKRITVWMRERIEHPRLIDSYGSTTVHMRTLQNLLRWLDADIHLRELVSGQATPLFETADKPLRGKLNERQYEAVALAMQMRDYLLIQGPPGTGKTSVIAEIVKNFVSKGQRVLLAAFTNQAVDNMLKRLDKEGFHQYIRIGHERSTDITVQERMLKRQLEQAMHHEQEVVSSKKEEQGEQSPSSLLRTLLAKTPVIASTTATWSSATYSPQLFATHEAEGASEGGPFLFDVAIIDEASQLTLPAILGALRFAKRFILVGDEKQLPPLVMSKEAAEQGLNESLFTHLTQQHPEASASLTVQYRMNKWISNFSSTVFYEKQLIPDVSVANRQLSIRTRTIASHERHMFSNESAAITQSLRPEYPLVFLDTGATEEINESEHHGTTRDERRSTGVKVSLAEAKAIREVVDALRRRGIKSEDIGVIAPYRAQVATIRRTLLNGDEASSETVMVDTVDRFQGGEREVIIFSFATMNEPAKESTQREFLTNAHRLNVALTRAKSKLILVGCVSALENLPILSRLITYCKSMKTIITYTPDAETAQTSVSNAS